MQALTSLNSMFSFQCLRAKIEERRSTRANVVTRLIDLMAFFVGCEAHKIFLHVSSRDNP
jgi:hypothetical protein